MYQKSSATQYTHSKIRSKNNNPEWKCMRVNLKLYNKKILEPTTESFKVLKCQKKQIQVIFIGRVVFHFFKKFNYANFSTSTSLFSPMVLRLNLGIFVLNPTILMQNIDQYLHQFQQLLNSNIIIWLLIIKGSNYYKIYHTTKIQLLKALQLQTYGLTPWEICIM